MRLRKERVKPACPIYSVKLQLNEVKAWDVTFTYRYVGSAGEDVEVTLPRRFWTKMGSPTNVKLYLSEGS